MVSPANADLAVLRRVVECIFRGVTGSVAGLSLHSVWAHTGLPVEALPDYDQDRVHDGIPAPSKTAARRTVARLQTDACPTSAPTPSAAPRTRPRPDTDTDTGARRLPRSPGMSQRRPR